MAKIALILGITGQDGSFLAELLLAKGYVVHGLARRSSAFHWQRIKHIENQLTLHYGDLSDTGSIARILDRCQPDEVYGLAAQSHVRISFDLPEYTADVTGTGTIRLLEELRRCQNVRFYQASSSEIFGSSPPPQNEQTPFHPRSPYGCAKAFSHFAAVNYRESYGMHASNGILFNHTSYRRGENFVSRKITRAVAAIKNGLQKELVLGNLSAKRDWGHAADYVEAQWLMLQQPEPDDYVIATGESHSVEEFLEIAFVYAGLCWQDYVRQDSKFLRPAEVNALCGDATKARTKLGWQPKIGFKKLVEDMVEYDLRSLNYGPTH
jgi:GDPmannose 4,6-dehydratase